MRVAALALGATALLVLVSSSLPAQVSPRRSAWELRADGLVAEHERAAWAGAGYTMPLGAYARAVLAGGVGTSGMHGAHELSVRADAMVRLTTDPFAERSRAPYVGAGLTTRDRGHGSPRTDLLLVVGVDGSARGRWAPAIEIGFGAGVRAGVALRRARQGRR